MQKQCGWCGVEFDARPPESGGLAPEYHSETCQNAARAERARIRRVAGRMVLNRMAPPERDAILRQARIEVRGGR